jgi:hypothetical protein
MPVYFAAIPPVNLFVPIMINNNQVWLNLIQKQAQTHILATETSHQQNKNITQKQ